jgi:hypothetical protein
LDFIGRGIIFSQFYLVFHLLVLIYQGFKKYVQADFIFGLLWFIGFFDAIFSGILWIY